MELKLHRRYKGPNYTIGDLYVNGTKICETLEDVDRGLNATMAESRIREIKVYGKTAIPRGKYRIQMGVVSAKFRSRPWATRWGGKLPRILSVPGYDGVLLHVGTTADDTDGCILVGENKAVGKVLKSQINFDKLMPYLVEADYRGETITIEIE